ncbi:MAG: 50S ribosomal protein L19 [Patescibacteria group bacterium]
MTDEQKATATDENTTETVTETQPATTKEMPHSDLRSGMTIRLHERISDVSPKGEKRERIQVFEGIILNLRGAGDQRTLTIRKVSNGVGVEKIFPISSPNIMKIEIVKYAKTRRNYLSFMRGFKRKLKETWVK